MITLTKDGEEKRFILDYNRLEIDVNSYKKAVEIFPDEDYWKDKLNLVEVTEYFTTEQLKNDFTKSMFDLSTKYWLTKKDHSYFSNLLGELGIDQEHLDNLALIAKYYEVYSLDPQVKTRKELAAELKSALEFSAMSKEPGYEFLRISVKGGFITGLSPRRHTNEKPYSFTHPSLMRAMKEVFVKWVETSPDYWTTIGNQEIDLDSVKSPTATLKSKQDDVMLWIYDYISENDLADSHQNASYLVGKLLSAYDFIPNQDHYEENLSETGSFASYDAYLANHMRTIIQRALKEKGRTNILKK